MKFLANKHKGALLAILSGFCYGLVGYFGINIIHADITISTMLFWRFMVAGICMCMLLIPQRGKTKTTHSTAELIRTILYGAALYSGTSIGYFMSSIYIGTGPAMVVSFTYPAIIMLLHLCIYKTRMATHYYWALILILSGMVFLVDSSNFTLNLTGIGFGLLSAAFYAAYILANKKNTMPPITSTLLVSIGCMITALVLSVISGTFTIPTSPTIWLNIIGLGILCTALPILFLLQSLQYISPQKASLLSVLEPVFVVIFGIALLNEPITIKQTVGICIILCGALVTLLHSKEG